MGSSQGKLTASAKSLEGVENNIMDNHSAFSLISCDFHSKMGASFAAILVVGSYFWLAKMLLGTLGVSF